AKEITDIPEIHPSQVADGHVIGNINLRWRTLPVIDFRGVIGNEEPFKHTAETLKNRKLLIFDLVES
ncbi:MAG: chemotaxis protein CheW, partial [Mangrovicoccus sp.]